MTYSPNAPMFKPTLAYARHQFAALLQDQAQGSGNFNTYRQAILEEIEALRALGLPVNDWSVKKATSSKERQQLPINVDAFAGTYNHGAVMIILMIVGCFLRVGDEIRAEKWLRAALWLENLLVGGGKKLFEERYKRILDKTAVQAFLKIIESYYVLSTGV
ncbi:hypothetical protein M422DRAFT_262967 [Sphaerobolus stellatus SS14]|uniref:Uncharacterized protein n=1 Tax=Sphaerobolus stellatus (strain SS14) TaxID=990650 RepID=A0A0C9UJG1_SPHS4|nr:hypothetical protein M422DRAFT_262967 [Sphaerobolus stellatus SS14]